MNHDKKSIRPLTVLSLGAGVQSSTIALMMSKGEIETADHAIFADTGNEPRAVYEYLEYLTPQLNFPVHIVRKGDLAQDFLNSLRDPNIRCAQPPFAMRGEEGKTIGRLPRQCTREYKIDPILKKIRELREEMQPVIQMIGISMDEIHRMKDSRVGWICNAFPLIDRRMSRFDCLRWIGENGFVYPPKSACWFCPYMSDDQIRQMRNQDPVSWSKLVEFDARIRELQARNPEGSKINRPLFVHRSAIPVSEVDLTTEEERGQGSLFGEECEGMCGL